jgi:hypothetical protein
VSGPRRLPAWDLLAATIPDMVTPMRRYLDQLACILRPGSVSGADLALRSLAGFLVEQTPEVRFIADIRRQHIEDFRTWLTDRPGYRTGRLTPATLAHRLGTLRMFFVRITDWNWPEAPARIPIIPADLPRQGYLPLHPHLITLISDYRAAHVDPGNPLLLPRENGRPLDRHTVTRLINKA